MQGFGLLSGKLVDLRPVLMDVVGRWRDVRGCAGTDSEDLCNEYVQVWTETKTLLSFESSARECVDAWNSLQTSICLACTEIAVLTIPPHTTSKIALRVLVLMAFMLNRWRDRQSEAQPCGFSNSRTALVPHRSHCQYIFDDPHPRVERAMGLAARYTMANQSRSLCRKCT